jgi:hypothetical protein
MKSEKRAGWRQGVELAALILLVLLPFGFAASNITTTGSVGVNTANPDATLHINGSLKTIHGTMEEVGKLNDSESGGTAKMLQGARGVFVANNYAYVTASTDNGLTIIDITDPTTPREVGQINDSEGGGTATTLDGAYGLYVVGDYAYVAANDDDGLSIIDVSDPSNPIEISQINSSGGEASVMNFARDVYVTGGYAYVTSSSDDSVTIIDVNDPTNPVEVGYIQDNSQGGDATRLDNTRDIFVEGKYAYVTAWSENSFSIFDVSDPTNIVEVGYVYDGFGASELSGPSGLYIQGGYAYVGATQDDALSIINISDPTNPEEVGSVKDDSVGGNAHMLQYPNRVVVAGGYAYVTSLDHGISVIDVSDPTSPVEVTFINDSEVGGTAPTLESPHGIFLSGGYAYVASVSDNGLSVIDLQGFSSHAASIGDLESEHTLSRDGCARRWERLRPLQPQHGRGRHPQPRGRRDYRESEHRSADDVPDEQRSRRRSQLRRRPEWVLRHRLSLVHTGRAA